MSTIKNLESLISVTSLRQKVIARNISNVNTEYYKREMLTFDECMADGMNSGMKKTEALHLGSPEDSVIGNMHVKVIKDKSDEYKSGINNVNIDKEMADLAENQIMFKFAARKINSYYKTMQEIIKGTK